MAVAAVPSVAVTAAHPCLFLLPLVDLSNLRQPPGRFLSLHPRRCFAPAPAISRSTICRAKMDGFLDRDVGGVRGIGDDDDDKEEEEEGEEGEGGVVAVLGLLQIFFRKVSRRAKKAARSVLPLMVPTQLVCFAVDGFLLLALLSIARALLEVVCNLGGTVFLVILLARTINAAALHYQLSEYENTNDNRGARHRTA